ncbi:MAG TPA: DUF2279 domain-containing protein [Kofleriaceae bacterium]
MRVPAIVISALISTRAAAQPEALEAENNRAKVIAGASVGAIHIAYATWSYFAWYRDADSEDWHIEPSSGLQVGGYAGGADKLGHVWSNYALTRATTAVLTTAGWRRLPSSLVSAGLTEVAFTLTEIQDGYVFGFDHEDIVANVGGAALAVVMDNVPAVDRLFDFRLQYFPSRDYRRTFRENGSVDVGQDYTGQSYILALHLGALPHMSESDYTYWARYVDFAVGFEAHHYAPAPPEPREVAPRQTLYLGLAINMQGLLNELFDDSRGRRIGRGVFEVYSLPYTTLRYAEASRSPM